MCVSSGFVLVVCVLFETGVFVIVVFVVRGNIGFALVVIVVFDAVVNVVV